MPRNQITNSKDHKLGTEPTCPQVSSHRSPCTNRIHQLNKSEQGCWLLQKHIRSTCTNQNPYWISAMVTCACQVLRVRTKWTHNTHASDNNSLSGSVSCHEQSSGCIDWVVDLHWIYIVKAKSRHTVQGPACIHTLLRLLRLHLRCLAVAEFRCTKTHKQIPTDQSCPV